VDKSNINNKETSPQQVKARTHNRMIPQLLLQRQPPHRTSSKSCSTYASPFPRPKSWTACRSLQPPTRAPGMLGVATARRSWARTAHSRPRLLRVEVMRAATAVCRREQRSLAGLVDRESGIGLESSRTGLGRLLLRRGRRGRSLAVGVSLGML
jgi:hypothetical protein